LLLGLKSDQLVLTQAHQAWADEFSRERQNILQGLYPSCIVVEHVGSTALCGVPAKPILDIVIGVTSFEEGNELVAPMESLGYTYCGEYGIPRRHYFVKGEPRTHHVHMLELGGEGWRSTLGFRDALLAQPELAREYAEEKLRLAAEYRDHRTAYQEEKDKIVGRLLKRIPARTVPVEKVLAYITRGNSLLVFTEPDFPEAGIQVPGGTLEPGETAQAGVLREAAEKTGLRALTIERFLGTRLYHSPSGSISRRHYFHLMCEGDAPEEWIHWEQTPHGGEPPIRLQLQWVNLDRVPELAGGRGALLAELKSEIADSY